MTFVLKVPFKDTLPHGFKEGCLIRHRNHSQGFSKFKCREKKGEKNH